MILMTGGSGLLGKYIPLVADKPTHAELDITKPITPHDKYDLIVHAAAYTNVQEAESHKIACFETNVWGTLNLLTAYPSVPFVYISSEYAKHPLNFYSLTKWMGEELVRNHVPHLIIRTLFKPTPWPYKFAFIDQYTQGDSVDIIAPLVADMIQKWNRKNSMTLYVGTGRKRIYDIAVKTKPDVLSNSVKDMKVPIPNDYA